MEMTYKDLSELAVEVERAGGFELCRDTLV